VPPFIITFILVPSLVLPAAEPLPITGQLSIPVNVPPLRITVEFLKPAIPAS